MGISLRTNIASIQANNSLNKTNDALAQNMTKLSSGMRINSAGDDAAGLAISEKFRADLRSLTQAKRNAMDGISLIQTAEGGMSEITSILMRMRELAMQGATDTVSDDQKLFLQEEFDQLRLEITRIGETAEYNGLTLLSGTYNTANPVTFQVGLTGDITQQINVALATITPSAIGIEAVSVSTSSLARAGLSVIDAAIQDLSARRATLGAKQNRLQVTINNINTQHANVSASNSRIRDVDVAEETADLTKNNILMQAGVSVLAQANQIPQLALNLLNG